MPPTILITRPEVDGLRLADQLRAVIGCSVPIMLSPIVRIERCGKVPDLEPYTHLIFTSRNGVRAYADQTLRRDLPCFTVGDATAETAKKLGISAISAGGAVDDLVTLIKAQGINGPCLHLRGVHGAGNVAARLTDAGIKADEAVLYRQKREPLGDEALKLLQGDAPVLLPLYSPRSAEILFSGPRIAAPLLVAAISENAAIVMPKEDKNICIVAKRPDAESMLDATIALIELGNLLVGKNLAQ